MFQIIILIEEILFFILYIRANWLFIIENTLYKK